MSSYMEDDYDTDDGTMLSSMKRLSVRRSFMGDPIKGVEPKKKNKSSGRNTPAPGSSKPPPIVAEGEKIKFKKLEPKTFFANEVADLPTPQRTFLQWLNSSVQLVTLGVGLTTFSALSGVSSSSGAFLSGSIFAAVGIIFMIYSVVIFRWRGNRLKQMRNGPYDDNIGPPLLVLAMIGAVTFTFVYESTQPTAA